MQSEMAALLRRVAAHVSIESSDELIFGDQRHDVRLRQTAGAPPSPYPAANPLVALLRDLLYQTFFTRALDIPVLTPATALSDFAMQLSQANATQDRWSEHWQVKQLLGEGRVLAQRHGAERMLWPGEFVLRDGPAVALRVGAAVAVFQPRESFTVQDGFYFAFGQAGPDQQEDDHLLRIYWNVNAAGAVALVASLTRWLNRFEVPFRFKCLSAAQYYGRTDAAVLYTHRRFYRLLQLVLDDVLRGLEPGHLRAATPPFTLRLRPGVSLAEDPPGDESFGMQRCRLLAEGLWNAFVDHRTTLDDRVERMTAHLLESGMSLRAPYLKPGSRFDYS